MTEKLLKELIACQTETNRWLRVLAMPVLVDGLRNALRSERDRLVYQESDGRTSREVGEAAGCSHPTVLANWRRWATAGLVEEVASGRYARVVDLSDVDLGEVEG